MHWREQFREATTDAVSGRSWQITFNDKYEAAHGIQLYVDYLREVGVSGWSVTNGPGNLSIVFPSGGRVWFDSFRHSDRPSTKRRIFTSDMSGHERVL